MHKGRPLRPYKVSQSVSKCVSDCMSDDIIIIVEVTEHTYVS